MNSFTSFTSLIGPMRIVAQLLSIPAALGFMTPIAVEAGGDNKHKGHHDHHSSHMTVSYTHLTLPTNREV